MEEVELEGTWKIVSKVWVCGKVVETKLPVLKRNSGSCIAFRRFQAIRALGRAKPFPPALDEVVLRALEREPQRRYQQVSEVQTEVESITRGTNPLTPSVGSPGLSDRVFFRRVTILMLIGLGLWAAVLATFAWGDIARAGWARKGELPYEYLSTLLLWLHLALLVYGSWWCYLLAKKPERPRSFQDFWDVVMTTPDPRIKKIWKPILIYLVLFGGTEAVLIAVIGVGDDNWPLFLFMYGGIMLTPFALMGWLWTTLRRGNRSGPGQLGSSAPPTL